jgi:hypothetical protein
MILLKCFLFSWFFTNFEPLQDFLTKVFKKLPENIFTNTFFVVLGCHKCLSFWITLICTFNIFSAFLVSYLAYILKRND